MKGFTFRLEQARRWRETQVALQKGRLGAASVRLTAALDAQKIETERRNLGAVEIAAQPGGPELAAWTGFAARVDKSLTELRAEQLEAEKALEQEVTQLVEANRRVTLLENLEARELRHWLSESDRETASFADEASLGRLQSGIQSGKRRARSSAG